METIGDGQEGRNHDRVHYAGDRRSTCEGRGHGATRLYRNLGGFTFSEEAQRGAYVARLASALAEHTVAEAEAYSKESSARAVKTFVRSGDVAEEIVDVARENDADIIIMGHDRRGRLESLIKGSVAEKVERTAPCPCLIYCLPKQD